MKTPQLPFRLPSPLERLDIGTDLDLWMKRDDLIHPVISGNKWRKLKGFFSDVDRSKTIVTFGGAYSNHLPALAHAARLHDMDCIGVVRGEELTDTSNEYLRYCAAEGMKLVFVPRKEFRELRSKDWQYEPTLLGLSKEQIVTLPEGGAGAHVMEGCGEIWEELCEEFKPDHLVISSGTGATVSGILQAMSLEEPTVIHVCSAVRGAAKEMVMVMSMAQEKKIQLFWIDEAFGGFGKVPQELSALKENFKANSGINIDLNYNAKLWSWLTSQQLRGSVVWVNTGGFRTER